MSSRVSVACLTATLFFAGCADKSKEDATKERMEQMAGGALAEVVPVRGTVFIDDEPAAGVNLILYSEGGQEGPSCRTDADGKYCWGTYGVCDGIRPGTYTVTFTHIPKPRKNDTGVDLFNGKYSNPASSKFKLIVEKGVPQTTCNYELKMKK